MNWVPLLYIPTVIREPEVPINCVDFSRLGRILFNQQSILVASLGDPSTMTLMNVRLPSSSSAAVSAPSGHAAQLPPALLYEMIRSFATLARTLNLSHAVKELGTTRQTVRRHIAHLEETTGNPLFLIEDRHYRLTEHGQAMLPEAQELLIRGHLWVRGESGHVGSLQYVTKTLPSGWSFFQQQRPLSEIWSSESLVLREAVRAWTMSGGMIESPHMRAARNYMIVYRYSPQGWICVEFGDQAFYVKWFGQDKTRSSVGKPLGQMPGGAEFGKLVEKPYQDVTSTQGIRLDHVLTQVPRGDFGVPEPVSYVRLLLGGRFPDNSPALLSLVTPTRDIRIHGVEKRDIPPISDDILVDMPKSEAKFEQFCE